MKPVTPATYDSKRIQFEPVVWNNVPNDPNQKYGRCVLKYRNPDGTVGPLITRGPGMNTYGVGDNYDTNKNVNGHSVCFLMGTSAEHLAFEKMVESIHQTCCEHMAAHPEDFNLDPTVVTSAQMVKASFKNVLNHPKNKQTNKIDTSKPKRIYAKLKEFKATDTKAGRMVTVFDDATSYDPVTKKMTRTIDPLCVRSAVEMIPAIEFDSIYIAAKPSLQVKLPRAAITRALEGSDVDAGDEDIGSYMTAMGLLNLDGPPLEVDATNIQNPGDLL